MKEKTSKHRDRSEYRKEYREKNPHYGRWRAIIDRCTTGSNPAFKNYGGRGIRVCHEWKSYKRFKKWAETSGYMKGLTLERIDNNGPYSPDNCCWATRCEQANNRRNNIRHTIDGDELTISQCASDLGVSYNETYFAHQILSDDDFADTFRIGLRQGFRATPFSWF